MTLNMAPVTALAVSDNVALIGSTEYETLQAAVDAATDGETVQLLNDITLSATVIIPNTNTSSFILDLNGKTLDGGSNIAIKNNGKGTLTITDSHLGGMVSIRGTNAYAIYNTNSGIVNISGGTAILKFSPIPLI
jgi:hypothetical protein